MVHSTYLFDRSKTCAARGATYYRCRSINCLGSLPTSKLAHFERVDAKYDAGVRNALGIEVNAIHTNAADAAQASLPTGVFA
jgi:hypothetical protein